MVMIRMGVSHGSERCSHDFRQNHRLYPSQYDYILFLFLYT